MPTLFQRLYAYRLEGIPAHRKQELGELVKETFFAQPRKKNYYKVDQREGSEHFKVLCYDHAFRGKMDEIILAFCKKYGFIPNPRPPKDLIANRLKAPPPEPTKPPKKERKKISKVLAYSSKSSKSSPDGNI